MQKYSKRSWSKYKTLFTVCDTKFSTEPTESLILKSKLIRVVGISKSYIIRKTTSVYLWSKCKADKAKRLFSVKKY